MSKRNPFRIPFYLFVIFLLIKVQTPVLGQFPTLNFKSITEKEGLSKDYVRSIFQDKDGFMWFGTPDGLDKFDGKNFINYNNLLKDTLASNYQISYDILEDDDGIIWIATYSNGVILFDRDKERVTRLKHDENNPKSLSDNRVLDVFEDRDKNIWVATAGGGLELWQKDSNGFVHYRNEPDNPESLGSNFICSISEDSKGNLWVLSIEGILSKFNSSTGRFFNTKLPFYSQTITLSRGYSHVVYVDSDDNVIVGSLYGLAILNQQTGNIRSIPYLDAQFSDDFVVTSILEIKKGIFALATTFQGMYLFNINTDEYVNYSTSEQADYFLNNTSVTTVYKSKNGLIWLGSWNAGVNMYDKEFSQFQLLTDIVESGKELIVGSRGAAFCISPDNKIWIASGKEEVIAYDPKEKNVKQVLGNVINSTVTCLYSNNDEVFIGTKEDGLIVYDFWKKNIKVFSHNPQKANSITSNFIRCVLQDQDENIWIGYLGSGLDFLDRTTGKISHFEFDANNRNSINSNVIYRMMEDSHGRIWIGTQDGLCYYEKDKQGFTRYPLYINKNNKIKVNTILDIYEDSNNTIWVGTDRAIFQLNPKEQSSTVFSPQNVSPYLVTNFMEDKRKNLWMTSYNKLFKLNVVEKEFNIYNFYNGSTTPSFLGYSSVSANGKFYLGSQDRVITFDPDLVVEDTTRPEIFITQLEVNNNLVNYGSSDILSDHISNTELLKLNYAQSSFSFTFAALEYSFPEKIQYAYKLENFDDDWVYSGNFNNRAVYTKIPPGKYIFHIKATNIKGDWYESDHKINIVIKAPLWNTLVFRLFILILIILVIYGYFLLRNRKLRRQKHILEETVKQRTLELEEAHASLEEKHEEVVQQNEMLGQISEENLRQKEELRLHNTKLEQLVDERTKELKEAKNKAEESDRLKTSFLTNMSHEIRTPMNAIVGFVNLLKEEGTTTEEKHRYIETINSSSISLLTLIDDILDLSMIEANQLEIRKEIFEVNELLEQLHSSYIVLNKNEDIEVRLDNFLFDQNLKIYSDKIRIIQILTNLLSNAIKFTKKGYVEIGLKMQEENLAFYVKDTGIGIKEKDFETIFKRFIKNEDDNDVMYRGAGLGLAISNALAQLLEGKLILESTFGKGSVFTFLLPKTIIKNENLNKPDVQIIYKEKTMTDKKILVVEDEDANFMYIESALKKTKIEVVRAENGIKAIKIIESGTEFKLVLMDIKMPEMDGYQATKIIKEKKPEQIIVAVTAFARPEEKIRFMEAGFNDYLSKPVQLNDLRGIIDKYCFGD